MRQNAKGIDEGSKYTTGKRSADVILERICRFTTAPGTGKCDGSWGCKNASTDENTVATIYLRSFLSAFQKLYVETRPKPRRLDREICTRSYFRVSALGIARANWRGRSLEASYRLGRSRKACAERFRSVSPVRRASAAMVPSLSCRRQRCSCDDRIRPFDRDPSWDQ